MVSCKAKELFYPPLVFNNTSVSQSLSEKHLDVIFYANLKSDEYVKIVSSKINKALGLLHKLQNLPLITI